MMSTSAPSDVESDIDNESDFEFDTDDDGEDEKYRLETLAGRRTEESIWYRHLASRLAYTAVVTDAAETDAEIDLVVAEIADMAMTTTIARMEAQERLEEHNLEPPLPRTQASDSVFATASEEGGDFVGSSAIESHVSTMDAAVATSVSTGESRCVLPPSSSLEACGRRRFQGSPCTRSLPESSSHFSSFSLSASSPACCLVPPPLVVDWSALSVKENPAAPAVAVKVVAKQPPAVEAARQSVCPAQPAVPRTPAARRPVQSAQAAAPSPFAPHSASPSGLVRPTSRTAKRTVIGGVVRASKLQQEVWPVLCSGQLHRKPSFTAHRLDFTEDGEAEEGRDSSLARGYEALGVEHHALDDSDETADTTWFSGLDTVGACGSPARSLRGRSSLTRVWSSESHERLIPPASAGSAMGLDLGIATPPAAMAPFPPSPGKVRKHSSSGNISRSASSGGHFRMSKLYTAPSGMVLTAPSAKAGKVLPALVQAKHKKVVALEHTTWGLAASKSKFGSVSAVF